MNPDYEGSRVGPYTLVRNLGRGSHGTVEAAIDEQTGERVAIKVVKSGGVNYQNRIDTEIKVRKKKRKKILFFFNNFPG